MGVSGRIPANCRLAMADINKEWGLLIGWLPSEGEVSQIDAKTLVAQQWEKSREAYSGMGLQPTISSDGGEQGVAGK